MLNLILTHTPTWVWALLAALLWQGLSQTAHRTASLKRITLLPLAMIGLSLFGTVSVFGSDPKILLAWSGAAAVTVALVMRIANTSAIKYDSEKRLFSLPGSWVPLVLIMGIFVTKFAVGFMTAMQAEFAQNINFALGVTTLYGAFSGIFLARAAGLWRLAFQTEKSMINGMSRA